MVVHINYLTSSKNIIFNTKLSLTSDNWTHWYKKIGITPSTIYKLTTGFRHRPLFRVTDYAFKCFERYNLNVGASRLLERHCQPVLDPPVVGFRKCQILGYYLGLMLLNSVGSCSVIYILHSKFLFSTIPPCTQPFFPFLLPLCYRLLVIYLVTFL
jgi:hypothetical protein